MNPSPREAVKLHREFVEAPAGQFPHWGRNWIVAALAEEGTIRDQYRKMEWDIDADIRKAATELRAGPEYSKEDLSYDLRQMWRRLLRNYAFCDAWLMEQRVWKAEKEIWDGLTKDEKLEYGNPYLFRFWRFKDLVVWRLGIAVTAGFALLASSSGLMDILGEIQYRDYWFFIPVVAIVAALFLALVEVQRRAGRRPWLRVLAGRALGVTFGGVLWTLPGAALQYRLGPKLCFSVSPRLAMLYASSALVLGFVFQLFWQERSIAEPL